MTSQIIQYKSSLDYASKHGKKTLPLEKIKKNVLNKKISPDRINISDDAKKIAKKLGRDAVDTLKQNFSPDGSVLKNSLELVNKLIPHQKMETKNTSKLDDNKMEVARVSQISGPVFVSGFQFQGISEGGTSLEKMSHEFKGGKHFNWSDELELLSEIKKMPENQALALIGHSFGGDTIVNISNKLNTPEYNFRKVDLLVTLDSVGFNNDIIPSNVRKNLNYIGDKDLLFNDGPNIARSTKATEIYNELRPESHANIDDSPEVQKKILTEINNLFT